MWPPPVSQTVVLRTFEIVCPVSITNSGRVKYGHPCGKKQNGYCPKLITTLIFMGLKRYIEAFKITLLLLYCGETPVRLTHTFALANLAAGWRGPKRGQYWRQIKWGHADKGPRDL